MIGEKVFQSRLLYGFSLEKVVPQDDFYRQLQAAVDLSWVRRLAVPYYSKIGRPSIDPQVFAKIELIGYLEEIAHDRALMRQIADRLSLRRYLGYDIDEAVPDHSTLSKTRKLLGKGLCQAILDRSVQLCKAAGMVGGVHLCVDKTVVKADASLASLEPRLVCQTPEEYLERVFAENDPAEDEAQEAGVVVSVEEQPGYPTRLPAAPVGPSQPIGPRAAAAGAARKGRAKEPKRKKGRKGKREERSNQSHVSRSDPEAELVSRAHLPVMLAHGAEFHVDSRAGVVVHAEGTRANLPEPVTVMKGVERERQVLGLKVATVSGDKGYGKGPLYKKLVEAGVVGYIPHAKQGNWTKEQGLYGVKDFVYDPASNVYICPAGKRLVYRHLDVAWPQVKHVWRAAAEDCRGCGQREACTTAKIGRSLCLSIYEPYYRAMDERLEGPGARLAAVARRTGPEREFADAKDKYGLRRAKYRGLAKFGYQVKMTAAVLNLKKYVRWVFRKGWGAGMKRVEGQGKKGVLLRSRLAVAWLSPSLSIANVSKPCKVPLMIIQQPLALE